MLLFASRGASLHSCFIIASKSHHEIGSYILKYTPHIGFCLFLAATLLPREISAEEDVVAFGVTLGAEFDSNSVKSFKSIPINP